MEKCLVKMVNISKHFGGVQALENAQFELKPGEVHGLIGENGAGKSTLMKILSGVYRQDQGDIYIDGEKVNFKGPEDALKSGVFMVYQELNLLPTLSIADNVFIGRESTYGPVLHHKKDILETKKLLAPFNLDSIDPSISVAKLTVAKQQMVEIAKGLSQNSKILVFDEPTAALANNEIDELFRLIRQLKTNGVAVVYISHRLEELFRITDRITIMRDGRYIDTSDTQNLEMQDMIKKMVGRTVHWRQKQMSDVEEGSEVVLEARHLKSPLVKDVSFKLRKGEILGFAGLMGAGRTEVARLIFGADWCSSGEIYRNGVKVKINNTTDAVNNGIGYLSENRKDLGLAIDLSIADNISMCNWDEFSKMSVVNYKKMVQKVEEVIERLAVKTPSVHQLVKNLSGGNQQKVVIAKWLLRNCDVLIFDEPTRGIDVGAKSEIHELMCQLVKEGKSIIMISSEMPELLSMCDRILVMNEGRLTSELDISEATQEKILRYSIS